MENNWYTLWEGSGYFKAAPDSKKPAYCLLMPPPNLTGDPHAGHTLQHLIMDAVARAKRMQGYDVLFQPGVDHAGIQFESTLNKLLEKEGLSKQNLGREQWLKKAWEFKDQVYKSFHRTWRLLGISADWQREVFTLDPKVQAAVLAEFKGFFDSDLIYKGAYIVQWCPKDQTAIEDVEMDYEEKTEKLYFINYKVLAGDKEDYITIATARPETIAADVAVAIYPNHPKFSKYIGMEAENPITKTRLPIIEDKRVEKDFGTGALKITPGHDLLDYEIGKDHNLEILHVVDKTGRITELDPNLAGLKIKEARTKAEELLKDSIEKIKDYTHSVPVCERCKTTVEPLISEEIFVRMEPLAKKALLRIGEVNFIPKKYLKILSDWIREIHDWCISRPLWWGYRIPVWYCQKCNGEQAIGKTKDMVISFEEPGKSCDRCKEKHWVQEEKILDTWFSSGMWPLATLGWPENSKELERYYPWDLEVTAREIRYLWIARMVMLGVWFKDQIPFKNMFFHGMLRPLEGPKFSKSLGNAVYASELTDEWGVDATRMALFTYTAPDRDGRTSRQILNERAKNFRNFGTKLKNISRFIVDLKPSETSPELASGPINKILKQVTHDDDKQILKKLDALIKQVTQDLNSFNMHLAIEKLYDFLWHELADKYIEQTKSRRAEAQPTLEYVFKTCLELLHPFMPFITEELWQKLPHQGKSIMTCSWPTSNMPTK